MKRVYLLVFLFCATASSTFAQASVTLDQAISSAAADISARLNADTRIAVLNFSTSSENMAEYVLEELNNALVNDGRLTVVDRRNLSIRQQELNFQMSGDVSDATAQSIGRTLGVQMIVSGSLGLSGTEYRFRVQALEVESGAVRYSRTLNVRNDLLVQSLMGGSAVVANFTAAERAGAAVLNLALGLGSFALQKDSRGGGITALFEGLGLVSIITSQVLYNAYYPKDSRWGDTPIIETYLAYPYYIGLGVYGVGAIYGIYRALSYQKPGMTVSAAPPPWNIAMVPDKYGSAALQLSYTLRW